jgi:hypothetical protein
VKKYLILIAFLTTALFTKAQQDSLKKEKAWKVDFAVKMESLPYAPFPAQTIGPNPVVIGIVNAKWKHIAQFSYWESVDLFGKTNGDYRGLFTTINPFGKKNKTFFLKNAHFFDMTFEKKFISVVGIQVKVGKFSMSPVIQSFPKRSPRQILMSTFFHRSFSLTNWIIREKKGDYSSLVGVSWKSPEWQLSKGPKFSVNVLYNKRVAGSFGTKDIVSIGTHFSFKK